MRNYASEQYIKESIDTSIVTNLGIGALLGYILGKSYKDKSIDVFISLVETRIFEDKKNRVDLKEIKTKEKFLRDLERLSKGSKSTGASGGAFGALFGGPVTAAIGAAMNIGGIQLAIKKLLSQYNLKPIDVVPHKYIKELESKGFRKIMKMERKSEEYKSKRRARKF